MSERTMAEVLADIKRVETDFRAAKLKLEEARREENRLSCDLSNLHNEFDKLYSAAMKASPSGTTWHSRINKETGFRV